MAETCTPPLGCEPNTARIVDRCNGPLVCDLGDASEVQWARALNETVEARITINNGEAPDCCGCLGNVRTRRHELVIHRGDVEVWSGLVVRIEYEPDQTVVVARDFGTVLDRRTIKEDRTFEQVDLTTIATTIFEDGLAEDDPCLLDYLLVQGLSGVLGDREYVTDQSYVGDELRDLGETGLDWTWLGRRLIFLSDLTDGAVVTTLRDEDFVGGLRIVEDGDAVVTRAVVVGDGVTGTAGGVDEFYGLVDQIVNNDTVKDEGSAVLAAQQRVDAGTPGPLFIANDEDRTLSVDAPVCINDLVPGVLVNVLSLATCREVSQTMRLSRVSVIDNADGEQVQIALVPIGSIALATSQVQ